MSENNTTNDERVRRSARLRTDAADALQRAARIFDDAAREMRAMGKRVATARSDHDAADTMQWAINHVTSNVLGNVRADIFCQYARDLDDNNLSDDTKR